MYRILWRQMRMTFTSRIRRKSLARAYISPSRSGFAVLFEVTSYALPSYLLVVSPNPLRSQRRSRSTSRVRTVSVSRRHESEYHLQESMGTVVASSSHIVPTIRWKALPQILEAAQAKSTKRNEKERERGMRKEKEEEGECDRVREGGGRGGLDRLIYLLSDQPTYLPTNLPPSNVDAYHVANRATRASLTETES